MGVNPDPVRGADGITIKTADRWAIHHELCVIGAGHDRDCVYRAYSVYLKSICAAD